MGILMLYGVFVIATLVVVLHSIMIPIVNELYTMNPRPRVTLDPGNKVLLYIILSLLTAIAAPIMFVVWLFPKLTTKFKDSLAADLKKS